MNTGRAGVIPGRSYMPDPGVSSPASWYDGTSLGTPRCRRPCQADVVACGVRIRLETAAPLWLDALLDRVPQGWVDTSPATSSASTPPPDGRIRWLGTPPLEPPPGLHGSSPNRPSRLVVDDRPVVTAREPRHLVERFEHELLVAIAARSPWLLLHAGVVVHQQRALVLPGRSFAGKSTLVHALVDAGAIYFSDDIAAIDSNGRVHAVPRRLALRCHHKAQHRTALSDTALCDTRRGRRRTEVTRLEARDLGWTPSCRPQPVHRFVLTRYRPGASFAPRCLSPGRGSLALFNHALSAATAPERTFRALAALASRVPVVATERGEAPATAAALLDNWNEL